MKKSIKRRTVRTCSVFAISIATLVYRPAYAEQASSQLPADSADPKSKSTEQATGQPAKSSDQNTLTDTQIREIVVTGTNITGVKPVGSEAVTLSNETIRAIGVSTVADAVRTLPQVRNLGDYREGGTQGSYNSQQGNAINLRGLGQQATLTLVDGHRLVATGAASNFTEANQVPIAALQRIEVILDGASAVYGSDAVAGVVNFVLRKDFNGIEASARVTNQSGGMEYAPSLTVGRTWDHLGSLGAGNILISYEYTHRNPYLAGKNKFLRQNSTALGGPDNRLNGTTVTSAGPANIYVQNANGAQNQTLPRAGAYTYYGLPNGANVGLSADQLLLNQPNLADSADYTDYTGRVDRHQVVLYANQELGDNLEVFLNGTYTHRHTFSRSINTLVQNVTLSPYLYDSAGNITSTANPYYISGIPGVAAGSPLNLQYSALKDLGGSNFDNLVKTYAITGGLRAKLPHRWKVETYYTYGRDTACNYCQSKFNVNATALQYQINIGAINPLSSTPLSASQIATFTGDNVQRSGNGMDDSMVKFDGPLFSLPGGEVKMAFGGERNKVSNYNVNGANRNANNVAVFDTDEAKSRISRTIWSAYGEIYVPLVGDSMNVPLVRSLTIDGAVRYDHYSDVGKTTNPKIGGTWVVNDALSFRGSWGTSFRAPSLPDVNLYAFSAGVIFPSFNSDPRVTNGFLNLPGAGLTLANLAYIMGSNPDLKPETAKTWSFGGKLDLHDFKLDMTYYYIKYSNRIASPNSLAAYQAGLYPGYAGYSQFVIPVNNPGTCSNANVTSADPVLQKYLSRTILYGNMANFCSINVIVDGRNTNLAATMQDGLDATLTYDHEFGEVAINSSIAVNWTMHNKEQVVSGAAFTNRLGYYNSPIEWRGRAALGAFWHGLSGNLFVNYTGSYTNDLAVNSLGNSISPQKVGDWVTVDTTIGLSKELPQGTAGPLKGLRASLSILNLFNRDPRVVITSQGSYNGQYSNPLGRRFTLQLTSSF